MSQPLRMRGGGWKKRERTTPRRTPLSPHAEELRSSVSKHEGASSTHRIVRCNSASGLLPRMRGV
jgi:hypothetical protein